jgi:hypothetical protein
MPITKVDVTQIQGFPEKIITVIPNSSIIDLDFSLSNFYIINGGNCTLNLINLLQCQTVYIVLNSTGSTYNITWASQDTNLIFRWANGAPPVFTNATANTKKDLVSLLKINNDIFGSFLLNL